MTASPKIGPFPQATDLQPQAKSPLSLCVAQRRRLRSGEPASRSDTCWSAAQSRDTGLGENRRGVFWPITSQPAIAPAGKESTDPRMPHVGQGSEAALLAYF